MQKTGMYIHIPFCKQKCLYCDFPSFAGQECMQKGYVEALCRELEKKAKELEEYEIESVFFGGGTPTVLSVDMLESLMQTIFSKYHIAPDAEITIEANPGTLDLAMCQSLRKMGFNRLSMGLQAWQESLLQRLGRIHSRQMFLENFANAKKAGFHNINIDLMFALPKQTMADWEETLINVMALQPSHISVYSLIIEEGTPFYEYYQNGHYKEIDEETDRAMYRMAVEKLELAGFHQYEISNFAIEGKQSCHNKRYWLDAEYMGYGLAAHSYWKGERFHNPYDMAIYMQRAEQGMGCREDIEMVSLEEQYGEFMFLGLRLMEGVEKKRFSRRFGIPIEDVFAKAIEKTKAEGLLEEVDGFLRLTKRGIDLSNQVFLEFLPD